MSAAAKQQDLADRLEDIRQRVGDPVRLDRLAEAVREILEEVYGSVGGDGQLYRELESLAQYIHEARSEIAQLRPQDIQSHFIPSATDELDAIVDATERATNQILDAAEIIEGVTADLPTEVADRLSEATTSIYEACNFQDITGQRITKVVKALKEIEHRVEDLIRAFDPEGLGASGAAASSQKKPAKDAKGKKRKKGTPDEGDLLNGPQLPDSAANQADIDKLLASLDD